MKSSEINEKTNLFDKISAVAIIALIIISIFIYYLNKNELNQSHRYSIGTIYKYVVDSNGGDELLYYYFVDNTRYISGSLHNGAIPKRSYVHKKFYVIYSTGNPQNCELLLDYPVPDSIKEAPPEGWEKIPNIPDWQQPK